MLCGSLSADAKFVGTIFCKTSIIYIYYFCITTIEKKIGIFIFTLKKETSPSSKTINLPLAGKVLLKKSIKAKYLGIRIKPIDGAVVTVPKRVSFKEAEKFVRSKEAWILKHLSRIKEIESNKIVFDESTNFTTKEHKIVIVKSNFDKTRITIGNGVTTIKYPKNKDVHSEEIQDDIKFGIDETLRREAKNYIPRRVDELAHLFRFKYNRLFLKNLKSRWGSCSGQNNINLNIHLMQLPSELIDYVILHELVHTVHKNHSKRFWNALEKVLLGSKKFNEKLKKYSPQKYLHLN